MLKCPHIDDNRVAAALHDVDPLSVAHLIQRLRLFSVGAARDIAGRIATQTTVSCSSYKHIQNFKNTKKGY